MLPVWVARPASFAGAADGGRGLAEGRAVGVVGDGFGGEVKEVGTGFDGDGKAFVLGCGDEREGECGGEMHDVEVEGVALVAGFAG